MIYECFTATYARCRYCRLRYVHYLDADLPLFMSLLMPNVRLLIVFVVFYAGCFLRALPARLVIIGFINVHYAQNITPLVKAGDTG